MEQSELSEKATTAEKAEDSVEPPEKSRAIEDCEELTETRPREGELPSASQVPQYDPKATATFPLQSSQRQSTSGEAEEEPRGWKEGARIGEASNPGPFQWCQCRRWEGGNGNRNSFNTSYFKTYEM